MTHASLFSGIGGFDLAAQWAGFENASQVSLQIMEAIKEVELKQDKI